MVSRTIASDYITGSYMHIERTLDKGLNKYVNSSRIVASINLKKLLQHLYVDNQKFLATTGTGSHTKTTSQLVIKQIILVSLDTKSNKPNENNSPGLLNSNFSITILDVRFPKFSPGLS